jgi:superfamily II DNA or RNA helicase
MIPTLRPDQQALESAVYNGWNSGHRHMLAVLPTGGGKCLGRDTPVLMFDGSVKMSQHVRAGDFLIGPDSRPRFVVATTSGIDMLYRVTPTKGDAYVVNSKHVLSLKQTNTNRNSLYPSHNRGGNIVNIPVTEYITKSKWFKHIHKGWKTPLDFQPSDKPLLLEPYFLGLWLGDGTSRTSSITNMDWEVFEYLIEYSTRIGVKLRYEQKPDNRAMGVFLVAHRRGDFSPIKAALKHYNLIQNKHIPHDYKRASREQRLQLLAGIIDSDGHNSGHGYDICFKNETLLDDVIFIARSLGFSAYKTKVEKTCVNNGVKGTYYRCNINGELDQIPVKIPRKKAAPRRQIKNVTNTGISVDSIGHGEYFGFQVMGPDNLFVLGDFTVTHNSVIMSEIISKCYALGEVLAVIAHRNELVGQMSIHVARRGIKHRVIGSASTISEVTALHREEFNGRSFINPDANTAVASIDTLNARTEKLEKWFPIVNRWFLDEAHHAAPRSNKWGKGIARFTNAYGLGVTATPKRADGMGLGSAYDGVFDDMVLGPNMRQLINLGALSDYEIAIPDSDFTIDEADIAAGGDWSTAKMREASKKSHIVGDVVREYAKRALGKKFICFATDVETANEMAANFNAAGISCAAVSAKTPAHTRNEMIRRFKNGQLMGLVNVDLFGEGFDVPAVEVVIMARPTASLAVYLQQFGRALRVLAGKAYGLVIDHVSNWKRHGFPDKAHDWSLMRREKKSAKKEKDPEEIELTACRECSRPYEKCYPACPYCGAVPPLPDPISRRPENVDGDLLLLTREMIAQMQAATELESPASIAQRVGQVAGPLAGAGAMNRQMDKLAAQARLRAAIAQWAGIQRAMGRTDAESYRRFWLTTGMDVLSAQALDDRAAYDALADKVEGWYQ